MEVNCTVFRFDFNSHNLTTVSIDSEPWFVASDVCKILEIANPRNAVSRLDDDEKGVRLMDTLGGQQEKTIINESGLYSLTMGSRKPEAKAFKKWVTSIVLPKIRKTGQFAIAPENPLLQLANAVLTAQKVIDEQSSRLALAEPKAAAFELITNAEDELCLTDAAKQLQVSPRKLNSFLQQQRWIFKRNGSGSWCAYQNRIDSGLMIHRRVSFTRSSGETDYSWQALVTPKGIKSLSMNANIQEMQK